MASLIPARPTPVALACALAAVLGCGGAPETAGWSEVAAEGERLERAGFVLFEGVEGAGGAWRRLAPTGGDAEPVVLPAAPRRVVSQSLASDEVLLEVLEPEQLVAVSGLATDPRYSLAVDAAARVTRKVTSSAEQILALRPDLVIVASFTTAETVRQLRQVGAPVLQLRRFDSLGAVRENLRVIGFATGTDRRVDRLLERLDRRLAGSVRRVAAVADGRPARVAAWDGGVVAGAGTIFGDCVELLGAVNHAAEVGLEGWPRVGSETVAAWKLDLLFVPVDAGAFEETLASVRATPGIGSAVEVSGAHLVPVPRAVFSTVSHHVATLVEQLAAALIEWTEARPAS